MPGLLGTARPRAVADGVTGSRLGCFAATTAADRDRHFRIRHEVFVEEQGVFAGSDRDVYDEDQGTIHVLGTVDDEAAGAVRLFRLDAEGRWQGDRLCVVRRFRKVGIGAPLVRFAVASAGMAGGSVMVAHIQVPNIDFFTHLGWAKDGPVEDYVGLPHQPMCIELPDRAAAAEALARLT